MSALRHALESAEALSDTEAIAKIEAAVADSQAMSGNSDEMASATLSLAVLCHREGRRAQACEWMARRLTMFSQGECREWLLRTYAILLSKHGQHAHAVEVAAASLDLARKAQEYMTDYYMYLSRVFWDCGERATAMAVGREWLAFELESGTHELNLYIARTQLADWYTTLGMEKEALEMIGQMRLYVAEGVEEAAQELLERLRNPPRKEEGLG